MSTPSKIIEGSRLSIAFTELAQLLQQVFVHHGTSPEVAAILAHNCASAERDGAHSHGIFRIPGYISTLASGWVNGRAVPQVTDVASGFVRVDAGNGFAQVAYHDHDLGLGLDLAPKPASWRTWRCPKCRVCRSPQCAGSGCALPQA